MNLRERHRDVAAYALGVLDPSDAFRFEEHLSECVECAVRLADLAPVASALGALAGPEGPEGPGGPGPEPSPKLLDRLLQEVALRRRRSSRRRLRLVATAAALIVALPALAAGLTDRAGGDGGPEDPEVRITATDAATGVYGAVDLRRKAWGTAVALRVSKLTGPRTCKLIVIGKDGEEHAVGNWSVPGAGYGMKGSPSDGQPLDIEVATALAPDEIGRFEVRGTTGEHLVSLDR
ncbi:anti-sigma factor family protein [Streptomyces sp. NPDC057445]|uniref:anti-sigma factor n=1 Tax=Streptomyces sp. NPDC057445 TaxID=3346136 RepID=UPI0036C0FB54